MTSLPLLWYTEQNAKRNRKQEENAVIYLLEDDRSIRDFVLYALNGQSLEAEGFDRPSAFWQAVGKRIPDLLLLDIMLPEEDGMEILRKLRAAPETRQLPVIMLTAKDTEFDRVMGLDAGADDYVAKPFSMLELISRIRAVLRRSGGSIGGLQAGRLYLSVERHLVRADGQDVSLTLKEFELLRILLENRGIVLTRNQLQDQVWGYEFDGESRTVDVHIRTLRQKLGVCGDLIETVRGVGYKIGEDA